MLRTIDRYVIREVVPPFLLSLLIFTFLLVLPPIMEHLENLLAKGVSWTVAARIIWTVVPQALGLTIPMSLLVGMLIGLGRLSGDREVVALLACGVSPYRLLRPVLALGTAAGLATLYVMVVAIPDANQTFREITFDVISKRVETDIRPRVLFQDFPGWVLYARDEPTPGTAGWKDLLVADTSKETSTTIHLARHGRLVLNRAERKVHLVLTDGTRYSASKPGQTDTFRFPGDLFLTLNPEAVFPEVNLVRGPNEKSVAELRRDIVSKAKLNQSPHPEIIALQQKFSIPVACLVFAIVGLALGMSVARDGKLAGFVVGIAVIFSYYIVFLFAEAYVKGVYADPEMVKRGKFLYAHLARWAPDIVLGLFGIGALIWRSRYTESRLVPRVQTAIGSLVSAVRARFGRKPTPVTKPTHHVPAGQAPTRTRPTGRPVVVLRVPRLHAPLPSLLDRYICRIYVRVVGLSFLGLLGLFYIADFIDRFEKIFKGQATASMVATLLLYKTPQYIYYVIPIATLLSGLVTFGLLSRSSELTVMKACGVSLYRAAVSVVLLSLLSSAALFSLEQEIMARANRKADTLDATIRGRTPRLYDALNRSWIIGRDGAVYHYTYFDPQRNELSALTVYRPDEAKWTLDTMTYAERVAFNDAWIASKGWSIDYRPERPTWQAFNNQPLDGLEPPDYFKTEQRLSDMMTVVQLRKYVEGLAASGANVIPLTVDLHKKLAFPFVTFVMTLLAVPFGVSTGRRGALYGIGLGIIIALGYWILISGFVAIGKGGLLAPVLAGWAPNILVVSLASYMFLTART